MLVLVPKLIYFSKGGPCSQALPQDGHAGISSADNPDAGAWQTSSFIVAAAHWGSLYADYVLTLGDFIVAWREMVSLHNIVKECMG